MSQRIGKSVAVDEFLRMVEERKIGVIVNLSEGARGVICSTPEAKAAFDALVEVFWLNARFPSPATAEPTLTNEQIQAALDEGARDRRMAQSFGPMPAEPTREGAEEEKGEALRCSHGIVGGCCDMCRAVVKLCASNTGRSPASGGEGTT